MPDTYQGCELWDFSLVDPDNRRPVDFELRRRFLERADAARSSPAGATAASSSTSARTLALRRRHPELFETGYEPLEAVGALADRVVAFGRRTERAMIIVVVPRLIAGLLQDPELPCPARQRGATRASNCRPRSRADAW